jgi:hypothetical protein
MPFEEPESPAKKNYARISAVNWIFNNLNNLLIPWSTYISMQLLSLNCIGKTCPFPFPEVGNNKIESL